MIITDIATGSAHWASYLINGDASGLEARDIELCDAWHARLAPGYVVGIDDDSERFSWSYGAVTGDDCAGGTLIDYIVHSRESV